MRKPAAACVILAFLTAGCAAQSPRTSETPTDAAAAAEAQDCAALAAAMETAEAERETARNVHGGASAASMAASILSFVPGVGIAALAVKGVAKAAKLAGKDAERAPAEAHAESLAQWEEMGCEGEA
jgi:hypothetical protein